MPHDWFYDTLTVCRISGQIVVRCVLLEYEPGERDNSGAIITLTSSVRDSADARTACVLAVLPGIRATNPDPELIKKLLRDFCAPLPTEEETKHLGKVTEPGLLGLVCKDQTFFPIITADFSFGTIRPSFARFLVEKRAARDWTLIYKPASSSTCT